MTETSHVYYEVRNTIDEYGHDKVMAKCETLDDAKRVLKTCADWYRERGTGTIYVVIEELRYVPVKKRKVFEQ